MGMVASKGQGHNHMHNSNIHWACIAGVVAAAACPNANSNIFHTIYFIYIMQPANSSLVGQRKNKIQYPYRLQMYTIYMHRQAQMCTQHTRYTIAKCIIAISISYVQVYTLFSHISRLEQMADYMAKRRPKWGTECACCGNDNHIYGAYMNLLKWEGDANTAIRLFSMLCVEKSIVFSACICIPWLASQHTLLLTTSMHVEDHIGE